MFVISLSIFSFQAGCFRLFSFLFLIFIPLCLVITSAVEYKISFNMVMLLFVLWRINFIALFSMSINFLLLFVDDILVAVLVH